MMISKVKNKELEDKMINRICPVTHTRCICKEFIENKNKGPCKYGLYIKKEL